MHIKNAYFLHIGLPRQMHITLTLVFADICIFSPKNMQKICIFSRKNAHFSVYFLHIGLPRKIHISLTPVFTNICIFGSPKICRKYAFSLGKMLIFCIFSAYWPPQENAYYLDTCFLQIYAFLVQKISENMHFP